MQDNSELTRRIQVLTIKYFEDMFNKYPTEIPYSKWHELYLSFQTMIKSKLCPLENILRIAETLNNAKVSDETENFLDYLPEKIVVEEIADKIRRGLSGRN